MARPKKKGVEYFPHDCLSGQTIFILEQQFGNDGYAFWFKLLEIIGTKEGHFIDCENIADFQFLVAKTRLTPEKVFEILGLLAGLDAIDAELWTKKIIFSNGFLSRISDVYVHRRQELPVKPSIEREKRSQPVVSGSESTQSKGKERKEKKTITDVIGASGEADLQRALKVEYEKLLEENTGKDVREVYKAIKQFIEEKNPSFAEPFVDAWNIFAPNNNLDPINSISADRRNKIRIRVREPEFNFFKILSSIRQNAFYRGENDREWKVTFNYVIESQKKYISIIEKFRENRT